MNDSQRSPARRASVCLLALTTIAGCAVGTDYEPPQHAMPAGYADSDASARAADLSTWWTNLGDETLTNLIDTAVVNSPDVVEAAGRVIEARALRAAAVGELLPFVDASADYTRRRTSETLNGASGFGTGGADVGEGGGGDVANQGGTGFTFDPESDLFQAGLALNWEIDLFGRLRRRAEAADRDLEAEAADFYAVRVALAADVGRAYVQARELQNRLRIAQSNADIQRRSLDLARARFENGLTGELDVAEALTGLQQTLATIPDLQEQLQQAKNLLSLLTGRFPGSADAVLGDEGPVPVPPREVAIGIPTDLLRRRPDILQAERELASSVAFAGARRADLYPRLNLIGTFGFASDEFGDVFDWDSRAFTIGPAIQWPIFRGGTLRALVRAQDAVTLQRAAAYERAVLTALREVEDALVAYARDRDRRRVLSDATTAARRAVELAEAQYAQGLVSFDRVIDSQRTLFLAEDELARVDASVTGDLIDLYRSVGGGWPAPPRDDDPATTRPTTAPVVAVAGGR